MTYPAESVQIGYQNHVEDIRSFLDSRHADHYTVFNLSQRNYRGAKFSNRVSLTLYQVILQLHLYLLLQFEGDNSKIKGLIFSKRLTECC